MSERKADVSRKTNETKIRTCVNLDGEGKYSVKTGVGFLDHMLELFSKHGLFDIDLTCEGDLHIDAHHSVEDIAITLGEAFKQAAGDKSGINRYGHTFVPMDETLVRCALDLSGRPFLVCETGSLRREKVGELPTEMVEHFWRSFSTAFPMNLHIDVIRGEDSHHIIEGIFKAVSRALRIALSNDERRTGVASTKGVL